MAYIYEKASMTVNAHIETFLNKTISEFSPEKGIADPTKSATRISVEYDSWSEGKTLVQVLDELAKAPNAAQLTDLIIGPWDFESSTDSGDLVTRLIELKDTFQSLTALFIGDITYEESEISWIQQSNVAPVLAAYPALLHFQVRGADGLGLANLQHDNLRTLIVETGGMPPQLIKQVASARLPKLERLELWLGSDNYGFEASSLPDLQPILNGTAFPELRHLGLMDSEMQDEVTALVCQSSILNQLKVLDLSMGTLTDKGGALLLETPGIRQLNYLNLRHHFLSEDMIGKLKQLGIRINLDDRQEEDDEYRYAEVTE